MTAPAPFARLAVSLAFLLAFLWQVLDAMSSLLLWTNIAAVAHQQLSAFAWSVLAVGLAIPVVAFVTAVLIGRRRPPGVLAVVLLVALCASRALGVSQLAFFQAGIGVL